MFNIRGNAKNGSVPEGDDVVEEITSITPASDSHGQGYVKLHLRAVKGGTTRTKYLSETKKLKARAGGQFKGKVQLRSVPADGTATGKPSFPTNEKSSRVQAAFQSALKPYVTRGWSGGGARRNWRRRRG